MSWECWPWSWKGWVRGGVGGGWKWGESNWSRKVSGGFCGGLTSCGGKRLTSRGWRSSDWTRCGSKATTTVALSDAASSISDDICLQKASGNCRSIHCKTTAIVVGQTGRNTLRKTGYCKTADVAADTVITGSQRVEAEYLLNSGLGSRGIGLADKCWVIGDRRRSGLNCHWLTCGTTGGGCARSGTRSGALCGGRVSDSTYSWSSCGRGRGGNSSGGFWRASASIALSGTVWRIH